MIMTKMTLIRTKKHRKNKTFLKLQKNSIHSENKLKMILKEYLKAFSKIKFLKQK